MTDQAGSKPISRPALIAIFSYLLVSSAVFLYVSVGLWVAVPQGAAPMRPAIADLDEDAAPADGSPRIELIDPDQVVVGTARRTIRLFGYNLNKDSEVRFDGVLRRMNFVNQNQLLVEFANSDLVAPGSIAVTVSNGEKTSNVTTLLIESASEAVGTWNLLGLRFPVSQEMRLLLLATFLGAFGASVMALQSIADYRGRNRLTSEWVMFYVVRPPVGGGVALIFYLVIRGGFLAGTNMDDEVTTPYGILAVAALVGMFSDKAILKLNEVFLTLFKAADNRGGKLAGLAIVPVTLPDAKTGTAYSFQLKAVDGKPPYRWSVTTLPAGLSLDPSTGEIAGTPSAVTPKAPYTFTVKDAKGATAQATFDLQVK